MASGSYVVSKVVTFLATLAIPSVAAGYGLAVALVNEVPDVAQVIPANRDSIFLTLVMGLGIHYINRNTPDKKETQLLINRGLTKQSDIEAFFTPKLEIFQRQTELSGIDKAWKRIEKAIDEGELIS